MDLPAIRPKISFITICPDFITSYTKFGTLRSAHEQKIFDIEVINLRDYAVDKHGSIDAPPYGGGDSMVLRVEPLYNAIDAIKKQETTPTRVIATNPRAPMWNQQQAQKRATKLESLILVCGRFGGFDQRFLDHYCDEIWSVGTFVISGGELACLTIVDSVLRLVPGVLGNPKSAEEDSYSHNEWNFEYPLYTRPPEFNGYKVPDELLSGNHKLINEWRKKSAL